MTYTLRFASGAKKSFRKLSKTMQDRVLRALEPLKETPRPRQAEKLSGREGLFRIRVGDYRAIYSVHDDELLVLVVKIGHRGKVYRGH
jgi:mRNA interferase RelE/StbE